MIMNPTMYNAETPRGDEAGRKGRRPFGNSVGQGALAPPPYVAVSMNPRLKALWQLSYGGKHHAAITLEGLCTRHV